MNIKYGIIGGGAWGRCYINALLKNPVLELTAVAEVSDESLAALKTDFPNISITKNYRDLLENDADIIAVVVPNFLHYPIGKDVLNAGKHLLMEKPFTLSEDEGKELVQLAEQKKLKIAVGHQFRLSSLWGLMKKMIDNGFIGKPCYALAELSRNPYRLGVEGWRFDLKRVGDWIAEEPIHFLDLVSWYFAQYTQPISVHASANTSNPNRPELFDNIGITIDFADHAFAVVTQTLCAFEHHQMIKVTGTKGALWGGWSGALDRTLHPKFFLKAFDGQEVREISITKMTGELYELEDQLQWMADAVQGKAPIHCTGNEGCFAVRLSAAALKSAQHHQRIEL
ncbi:MAG: Gfo/Idh/MocA family oxidoreductase [Planctomycetaceae bacterium]|jgi:myo-inositol 2-dehydrogenase/D-chiro-inositol 1-dehydrogenase|nr:Gfo/Idh/MocA family oxidoreductase [Planctomycetaceae bacterium]